MKNVLVFPCGSEIGLEINRALKYSKHFKVFGASSVNDHGKFEFDNYADGVPNVSDDNFIDHINYLVKQYNIDFIFPAHDSVVVKMIEEQHRLSATVITSDKETSQICRSKSRTYDVFKGLLPVPKTYDVDGGIRFPTFLKPDVGQGAKGTYKVANYKDIKFYVEKDPSLLILEYLPGREYTVDCFTNRHGQLIFSEGRERGRINNGISVNSKKTINHKFTELAEIINSRLKFRGAWFYQLKERSDGELVLMEISPRIAGTMELFRNYGINFAQLSLFDRMGIDVSIINNNIDLEIDRSLSAKYKMTYEYNHVYIDLDDTILINDKINSNVMKFLYECINNHKKIHLLTKHRHDVEHTLCNNYIDINMFTTINQISQFDHKPDFIIHKDSIFIDDSFAERKRVSDNVGIPVFDVDAIDCLM